jgi:hypothetical protein
MVIEIDVRRFASRAIPIRVALGTPSKEDRLSSAAVYGNARVVADIEDRDSLRQFYTSPHYLV